MQDFYHQQWETIYFRFGLGSLPLPEAGHTGAGAHKLQPLPPTCGRSPAIPVFVNGSIWDRQLLFRV